MRVSHLALTDYRSYRSAVVELPAGVTVLQGQNGRGKTNLVEALAYLSTFSSHRGASPANLVRANLATGDDPGGAVIRAKVESGTRSYLLELEVARGRANRARVNRAKVPPRQILGILRSVVFAPEDLMLLRGDPSARRTFLDEVSVKLKPHQIGVLQDFGKVSRQRAATLKQLGKSPYSLSESMGTLEVWDKQFAQLSAIIVAHRMAVTEAMDPLVRTAYTELTDADRLAHISYQSHLGTPFDLADFRVEDGRFEGDAEPLIAGLEDAFLEAMSNRRENELVRGVNLVGAHRDDLQISLDGLPVKGFASHGEMWSAALTLRLAEAELLKQDGNTPVLILDDVFAELDETRRTGLISRIQGAEQVLITVAVPSDLPPGLEPYVLRVTRNDEGLSQVEPLDEGVPQGDVNPSQDSNV